MADIAYHEIMTAEHRPDVYDGPNCDQHRPRWVGWAEGDKDGPGEIGDLLELSAKTFPPGTKIVVSVPVCPGEDCDFTADFADAEGKCPCGFDWRQWASEEYS